MISRQEFTQFLWESLQEQEYVWLNPGQNPLKEDTVPDILIPANKVRQLLQKMRHFPGIQNCHAAFRFHRTMAVFAADQWTYSINFLHKMVSKNLFFLEAENVLTRRVQQENGVYISCVEHLLEYSLLNAFLNRKGIAEEEYRFFKEFHILVQEDLVEFFNEKYQTDFKDLYALTVYRSDAKDAIIQRLKEMPLNRLTKIMHIRWYNFLGNLRREAKII